MSQPKGLKLEVLKVAQLFRLSRPGVQPVDKGARRSTLCLDLQEFVGGNFLQHIGLQRMKGAN